ncbi:MAG: dihydroorotase family protein [Nitrososphaerota archaeon]|nr:dihydroorotase family protein [Nitrososphaerota archaeon]
MEHDLVLGGRVVTPGGVEDLEIGVSDGLVREVGRALRGSRRIDAGRCLIFPGFIDLHVHLREPGWERKEDFRTGTRAAAHGGVTAVVDMPNNPTPATTREAVDLKARLAREKAVVGVMLNGGVGERMEDVASISGRVVGYKLYMSETTGASALPKGALGRVFNAVAATGKPLSVHCEDQEVLDETEAKAQEASGAGTYPDVRPPRAETEAVGRVVAALRETRGLRANVCHASTAETLRLVRSGAGEGLRLSCEASLHHLYFSKKALLDNRLLRTNPPLREEEDRKALLEGIGDSSVSFLVTDHAPHLEEEKEEQGLAGVPGLDDYSHVVSWLIRDQGVDPTVISRVASANPAAYLGLGDRGEISPGKRADFTVLDLRSPEVVRRDDVQSRCGWSPYEGREFPGRARYTIVGGEPVLDDGEQAR